MRRDFGFGFGFDPEDWTWLSGRRRKKRRQWFESGEMKYVILTIVRKRPMHGYEVMKALEDQTGGYYKPSPGTVYPTLQWLEDEGYVRAESCDGKKTYHITRDGEAFLDENKSDVEDIFERLEQMLDYFVGGSMPEIHKGVGSLVRTIYRSTWRHREDESHQAQILKILETTKAELERL